MCVVNCVQLLNSPRSTKLVQLLMMMISPISHRSRCRLSSRLLIFFLSSNLFICFSYRSPRIRTPVGPSIYVSLTCLVPELFQLQIHFLLAFNNRSFALLIFANYKPNKKMGERKCQLTEVYSLHSFSVFKLTLQKFWNSYSQHYATLYAEEIFFFFEFVNF